MKSIITFIVIGVVVIGALLGTSAYTIDEAEQAIVVQFGKPVGETITEPGLHFKLPFVQEVRRFDKRFLSWDGDPNQIPTRGEQFISVDTTARWRISDPLTFLQRVHDERGALNRLNDILDSVVRDHISSSELSEIVRSRDWAVTEEDLRNALAAEDEEEELLQEVRVGREQLVASILETAQKQMHEYGIILEDIRIKRVDYVAAVQERVFDRMIAERQRIAEEFRSEGSGRAAEIKGQTDRLLAEIISEAERQAEVIHGTADAEATRIYNEAFGADPEFYTFFRTLESYADSIGDEVTMVIGSDSEYFRYFQDITPTGEFPAPRPAAPAASDRPPATPVLSPEARELLEKREDTVEVPAAPAEAAPAAPVETEAPAPSPPSEPEAAPEPAAPNGAE
jgi:membrane protease subunit HflC